MQLYEYEGGRSFGQPGAEVEGPVQGPLEGQVEAGDLVPRGPPRRTVRFVSPSLFYRVVQLVEGVGQFDTVDVELEALGDLAPRFAAGAGQGGLTGRVVVDEDRTFDAEPRFDLRDP